MKLPLLQAFMFGMDSQNDMDEVAPGGGYMCDDALVEHLVKLLLGCRNFPFPQPQCDVVA